MWPWIITCFTVLVVLYLSHSSSPYFKRILHWLPAILFAYIIPAIICRLLDIDYSQHSIHAASKTFLIPLAIVTSMASLSLQDLRLMGWKPIAVFVSGSCWIALFPIVFVALVHQGALIDLLHQLEYWRGLPPIVGSWIGGSTSQLVLKELVECPENVFLTILVLDNILVNIWTILMFQTIKQTDRTNALLRLPQQAAASIHSAPTASALGHHWMAMLLAGSVLALHFATDQLLVKILALSVLGMLFSHLIPRWSATKALQWSGFLIIVVMAILGLRLQFDSIEINWSFLLFLIVWLVGHFLCMLIMVKILKVDAVWVPIASMANVGGIATAPAVTAAYDTRWMPHAIVLAVLSMATGTFWGMVTIFGLKFFFLT